MGKKKTPVVETDLFRGHEKIKVQEKFEWTKNQTEFIKQVLCRSLNNQVFFLDGMAGCLDGDTLMAYSRGKRNGSRQITLADLYRKFNGLNYPGKQWEDLSIPTRLLSHDSETGRVFYNEIVSVIDSGVKEVMLLTTKDGRKLRLTRDHPVLTDTGYVKAEDLKPEQELIVKGSMMAHPNAVRHGRQTRVIVEGLKYYSAGWHKFVTEPTTGKIYEYKRQHRARLVYEAYLNGLNYDEYISKLKTDPEAIHLETIPSDYIVHHMDENAMNDSIENLQILDKAAHDRIHADEATFNKEYTTVDYVKSVIPDGTTHTYDIQMEKPGNNFAIANGLIVHNTGKSLVSAYCALRLLQDERVEHVYYVRSPIEASVAGKAGGLGFMPGDQVSKFDGPYGYIFEEKIQKFLSAEDLKKLQNQKAYSTIPCNFLRGADWHNVCVIVDEASNFDWHVMELVLTRLGQNCKLIICGDMDQNDLPYKVPSAFPVFYNMFDNDESRENGIISMEFTEDDIKRSELLKYITRVINREKGE